MKHLKRFNENKESSNSLHEFLLALNDELKHDGFFVDVGFGDSMSIEEVEDFDEFILNPRDSFINISGSEGTYLDFIISDFSIQNLKDVCNKYLDNDKNDWPSNVSDQTKDNYDLLCTSILTFIDKDVKFNDTKIDGLEEWWDVISILDVDKHHRGINNMVKKLISKYNISRK